MTKTFTPPPAPMTTAKAKALMARLNKAGVPVKTWTKDGSSDSVKIELATGHLIACEQKLLLLEPGKTGKDWKATTEQQISERFGKVFTEEDLSVMHTYDLTERECCEVAKQISARTGMPVKPADYLNWLTGSGSGSYDHFDKAVIKLLADKPGLYEEAEALARLDQVVWAILRNKDTVTIGGLTFDFNKKQSKKEPKIMATKTDKLTATEVAIRALRRKNGATAAELQEETGWAARPSSTYLRMLAERHGYKHSSEKDESGILVHYFAAQTQRKRAA